MLSNSTTSMGGRVAVVTGSNKNIGYFIALQLGCSGLFSHIVLACRDRLRGIEAAERMQQQVPEGVQITSEILTLGDSTSHHAFANKMKDAFGERIDCLVNNAAMAFKQADPTPFAEQTKPTLDVNFRGTVDLTLQLLPLLQKGRDPRLVNVASMAGRLNQVSPQLQEKLQSESLTLDELQKVLDDFEQSTKDGTHLQKGYSGSNYGMSKLAVIAFTKVLARQYPNIAVNACCPGYCQTDMTSQRGTRDPADGAKNAILPATVENPPTGAFYKDYQIAQW